MNSDNIERIIQEELEQAKKWANDQQRGLRKIDISTILLSVAIAVAVYFILQSMQPGFVKVVDAATGAAVFDQKRAIIVSVLSGLFVILAKYLL